MGSSGIERRKPRRRLSEVDDGAQGGWELQNSPYTFEGQMEGFRRFGRGVSSASPQMRLVAIIVAVAFILPMALGVMFWVGSWVD